MLKKKWKTHNDLYKCIDITTRVMIVGGDDARTTTRVRRIIYIVLFCTYVSRVYNFFERVCTHTHTYTWIQRNFHWVVYRMYKNKTKKNDEQVEALNTLERTDDDKNKSNNKRVSSIFPTVVVPLLLRIVEEYMY